jgi:ACS family sodium-dependent inorganic phosphate cotransporter
VVPYGSLSPLINLPYHFPSSAFFWGYALTQIPAGFLASRLGGAKVLSAGVALWSVGTALAPPAAALALPALCASRLLVGLGEGLAPSAATALLVQFIPARERARAVSLVWGGLDLGSVIGLLIAPLLIHAAGWQAVFYAFAVLGGVWCLLWPRAQPHASAAVALPSVQAGAAAQAGAADAARWIASWRSRSGGNAAATAAAASPAAASAASGRPPLGKFARSPAVWAVVITHFCFNYGYYTLLAWLPSYFESALGMDLAASSALSLLPYVAMVAMTPVVGPVADALVARGLSVTAVRKLAQGVAFLGPACCMLTLAALTPAAGAPPPPVALVVALMSAAFALSGWSRAGLYCNHQDLSPRYASLLLGISNTAGALPGVLGVWAAGVALDRTGSWALALFLPTAAAQLVGALVFSVWGSGENQGWDNDGAAVAPRQ